MFLLLFLYIVFWLPPSNPAPLVGASDWEYLSRRAELPDDIQLPDRLRSVQDIVWSCLATIFACTWVAVHPNIPGPKESQWARFRRRFSTMFYAMVAPEIMTLWAMRQRYAAARIKRMYNQKYHGNVRTYESSWGKLSHAVKNWFRSPNEEEEKLWTLAHAFFIQMGGFLFVEEGKPPFVVTFHQLQELIDDNIIDLPCATEDDIFDKSKGDLLTKLLVVLQTAWFITHCIVRWGAGLTVTALEVVTLAFAILNIVTYSLWWQKPQNVQTAFHITRKGDAPPLPIAQQEAKKNWIERKVEEGGEGVEGWMPWMVLVTFLVPFKLLRGLFAPLGKMATDDQVPAGANRVPEYYADHDITEDLRATVFPSLIMSVIFGAIHLAAWNDLGGTKQQHTEQLLWRISAVIIAVEPLPATIGTGMYRLAKGGPVGVALMKLMGAVSMSLGSVAFVCLPIYIVARLTLLFLAFTTLRDLPSDALVDIAWSSFVPHI